MQHRGRLLSCAAAAILAAACVGDQPQIGAAADPAATPDEAPPAVDDSAEEFTLRMRGWYTSYSDAVTGMAGRYADVRAAATPHDRATCNALLTASFAARDAIEDPPDADIAKSLAGLLEGVKEYGHACLQGDEALLGVHAVLVHARVNLIDQLAEERYGVSDSLAAMFKPRSDAVEKAAVLAENDKAATAPQRFVSPVVATEAAARVTESNNSWLRFAWRMRVTNQSGQLQRVRVEAEFVDSDGFTIDSDTAYGVMLAPGESRMVSGDTIVRLPAAARVHAVRPVIQ